MKIALITYNGPVRYAAANGFNEGTDILPYLQRKGLDIHQEIWDKPATDWTQYDVALLKTPWDYHQRIDEFRAWLDKIEGLNIKLLNDYKTVRWNIDKRYLKEVIDAGMSVIPSVFLQKGWEGDLNALFTQLNTKSIIVKPCISGGSKNTIVVKQEEAAAAYPEVVQMLTSGDFIVQPLMEEVTQGEWSHIFFNGRHSHTILKKPKSGDFRVQQIYGGTIAPLNPTDDEIAQAQAYVDRFAKDCVYARIDGLVVNGTFMLMELELTEPFLYLSYGEHAVEDYYNAILQHL